MLASKARPLPMFAVIYIELQSFLDNSRYLIMNSSYAPHFSFWANAVKLLSTTTTTTTTTAAAAATTTTLKR